MYTYACNEVEDEVVQKVVYSINGTARTYAGLTARRRVSPSLLDLIAAEQLR